MKKPISHAVLACAASLCLLAAAHAASGAASAPPGPPPGPPPEAVAACKGKTEGTQVSFTLRGGETVSGVCQKLGDVIAARPLGAPPGGAGNPPPPR
jgi:hypothetical protein